MREALSKRAPLRCDECDEEAAGSAVLLWALAVLLLLGVVLGVVGDLLLGFHAGGWWVAALTLPLYWAIIATWYFVGRISETDSWRRAPRDTPETR